MAGLRFNPRQGPGLCPFFYTSRSPQLNNNPKTQQELAQLDQYFSKRGDFPQPKGYRQHMEVFLVATTGGGATGV